MSYFSYNSKKVYYIEIGKGIPLLLLHGNTASSNMFMNVVQEYSSKYKVILIDFLGHGQSDRLKVFPIDLWYDEAQQVITFLKLKGYEKVLLIGSSGGALVALNVALERPELVDKVVADSFEGEKPIDAVTENIVKNREYSKKNTGTVMFYKAMHGDDWESVVDNDTLAVSEHAKNISVFFHKQLSELIQPILFVGSKEDELIPNIGQIYTNIISKIGHGEKVIHEHGGHPAIISNQEAFVERTKLFFDKK